MKVVLYGATGRAGSRILEESLRRGHRVTAAAKDPGKLPRNGIGVVQDDLSDSDSIARIARGHEAVISAYAPPPDDTDQIIAATRRLVEGVKTAGRVRFLMVGAAGSLEVAPGVQLIESGSLPEAWRRIALSHRQALQELKASDIDWTYLSPAAFFEPGERTGKFRLGKDNLIVDAQGESRISMEDYAIALVDELERPAHPRQRFSVGY